MRRLRLFVACGLLLCINLPAGLAKSPPGYNQTSQTTLITGVSRHSLKTDTQAITVARIAPDAPVTLAGVLSNDVVAEADVAGRFERTSSACQRLNCLVAVNADYAYLSPQYDSTLGNQPIGAVISGGQVLRSPVATHHQFVLTSDGSFYAGQLSWTGSLVATGNLQKVAVGAVNRERETDQAVLYTPAFGPSTLTNSYGHELVLAPVTPGQQLLLGQTVAVRLMELRQGVGNSAIPPGGLVLSGHGQAAADLATLWALSSGGEALIHVDTLPRAATSVGGSPVLVRNGKIVGQENVRHPRTLVGSTATGELLLVTVDGRQPGHSLGMTLQEAGQLMLGLGATNAINLDGGGSTTFVERGSIINRPSDRQVRRGGQLMVVKEPSRGDDVIGMVERPVSSFLAVVAKPEAINLIVRPLDTSQLKLPRAVTGNPQPPAPYAASPVVLVTNQPPPPAQVSLRLVLLLAVAASLLGGMLRPTAIRLSLVAARQLRRRL